MGNNQQKKYKKDVGFSKKITLTQFQKSKTNSVNATSAYSAQRQVQNQSPIKPTSAAANNGKGTKKATNNVAKPPVLASEADLDDDYFSRENHQVLNVDDPI